MVRSSCNLSISFMIARVRSGCGSVLLSFPLAAAAFLLSGARRDARAAVCSREHVKERVKRPRNWELLVLSKLKWDVAGVTAHDFVPLLLARLPLEDVVDTTMITRHTQTFISLAARAAGLRRARPPSRPGDVSTAVPTTRSSGEVQSAYGGFVYAGVGGVRLGRGARGAAGASHAAGRGAFQHASPSPPPAFAPPAAVALHGSYVFMQRFLLFSAVLFLPSEKCFYSLVRGYHLPLVVNRYINVNTLRVLRSGPNSTAVTSSRVGVVSASSSRQRLRDGMKNEPAAARTCPHYISLFEWHDLAAAGLKRLTAAIKRGAPSPSTAAAGAEPARAAISFICDKSGVVGAWPRGDRPFPVRAAAATRGAARVFVPAVCAFVCAAASEERSPRARPAVFLHRIAVDATGPTTAAPHYRRPVRDRSPHTEGPDEVAVDDVGSSGDDGRFTCKRPLLSVKTH
ncbi:hypothetical protein EVAR_8119_1 [Eumeta japonica]|uniref:Uncharacterized protein n=1 Tax=Eumeta variegata TaxID=151549 RepID=A0A4C1TSS4_EUMVA|nr:hypothetical protein EVAR_8119_1 [Eumeta japonica]